MSTRARSLTKGITWRIIALFVTVSLVYIFTGDVALTAQIGLLDLAAKFLFYYLHERAWNEISWGKGR